MPEVAFQRVRQILLRIPFTHPGAEHREAALGLMDRATDRVDLALVLDRPEPFDPPGNPDELDVRGVPLDRLETGDRELGRLEPHPRCSEPGHHLPDGIEEELLDRPDVNLQPRALLASCVVNRPSEIIRVRLWSISRTEASPVKPVR